jgi:hypothetical protein
MQYDADHCDGRNTRRFGYGRTQAERGKANRSPVPDPPLEGRAADCGLKRLHESQPSLNFFILTQPLRVYVACVESLTCSLSATEFPGGEGINGIADKRGGLDLRIYCNDDERG